ncbi:MAG TPA: TraR/DksA C4-type zinc finger protein [Myxococcota bacterium]|nr:TraR/DksA C4-type zinc finger protein [Myxococcota bacterium]
MRHHFHRCRFLTVVEIDAADLGHARKGGSRIVDELCEARKLAPCVGLAECEVLSAAQKRDLLVARATRLRDEEGGESSLADAIDPRARELRELREELLEERREIVEGNRRRRAEEGAAVRRNPSPLGPSEESELRGAGVSVVLDEDMRELRTARLDAIDRAIDALGKGARGDCARCGRPIERERLREAPDTVVCVTCAREATPEERRFGTAREPAPLAGR